jgi:hypothetical protein
MNQVLRESLAIYLAEGRAMGAYAFVVASLAAVECMTLLLPSFDAHSWTGPANVLKVAAVAALVLIVFFSLKVVNQEIAPWRFTPLKSWLDLDRGGVGARAVAAGHFALLCLITALFIAVCAPLLFWAGAISRTPLPTLFALHGLIFLYALTYGVWVLFSVVRWERSLESRQAFMRFLFFSLILFSAIVAPAFNPAAFLIYLLAEKELAPVDFLGLRWSAPAAHFGFHVCFLALGFAAYGWSLKRGRGF